MEKIITSLTEIETKVLQHLDKKKKKHKKIAEETGLKEIEVLRGISWLESKKLVNVENRIKQVVELTKTGKIYLKEGLPEERFLAVLVQEGALGFDEIKHDAKLNSPEFKASMGILKSNRYIKIKSGKVKITPKGSKRLKKGFKIKKTMKKAPFEAKKETKEIRELNKRGIVSIEVETEKLARLTKKGRKAKKKVKQVSVVDRITPSVIKQKKWENRVIRRYDVESRVPKTFTGKKQPYLAFLDDLKKQMASMGFKEMKGPIIETNFWNCDALFMPQDHPARGIHDIYYVKDPKYGKVPKELLKHVKKMHENGLPDSKAWGGRYSYKKAKRLILRSQGTSLSARMLASKELEIPGKYFSIARVFRPDTIDWNHLTEFNQVEGIIVGEDLNMKSLFGVLKIFAEQVAEAKKYKFSPDYFPFTEPSVELSAFMENKGWVELGGAGIFRPEVTKPFGIDVPVIAWGLGIDRIYMIKNNVHDMRNLFSNDLEWIRGNA